MAKTKAPYRPHYVGDESIETAQMGLAERGLYWALKDIQWANGFIECDESGTPIISDEWLRIWPRIKSKFTLIEPGKIQFAPLEVLREKQKAFSENQSAKANKRWHKDGIDPASLRDNDGIYNKEGDTDTESEINTEPKNDSEKPKRKRAKKLKVVEPEIFFADCSIGTAEGFKAKYQDGDYGVLNLHWYFKERAEWANDGKPPPKRTDTDWVRSTQTWMRKKIKAGDPVLATQTSFINGNSQVHSSDTSISDALRKRRAEQSAGATG
jgi:hypothetical protein